MQSTAEELPRRVSNLPRVRQLIKGGPGMQSQAAWQVPSDLHLGHRSGCLEPNLRHWSVYNLICVLGESPLYQAHSFPPLSFLSRVNLHTKCAYIYAYYLMSFSPMLLWNFSNIWQNCKNVIEKTHHLHSAMCILLQLPFPTSILLPTPQSILRTSVSYLLASTGISVCWP